MKIRASRSRMIYNIINYTFFALCVLLCLYPLWYIFIYSISIPEQVDRFGVMLWPRGFTLQNFQRVLTLNNLAGAAGMSVLRTVVGTCITVLCCMLLGYLFTKETMPARSFLYRLTIVTMYINGGMIPTYLIFRAYGLLNSFWVYILPNVISAYYIILIKTYIEQLPPSLEESALIDGAGTMTIFTRIILPLSMPILATIAIYAAVAQWNSWFDNHIYTFNNKKLLTLQYLLYNYLKESENLAKELSQSDHGERQISRMLTPSAVRMTVTAITVLPILCVYPLLQRYIIKGILIGSVKG